MTTKTSVTTARIVINWGTTTFTSSEVRTITITSPFNTYVHPTLKPGCSRIHLNFDRASADSVLKNAVPSWLESQALTNSAAESSLFSPQTSNGPEPTWFATLPNNVKSYYISGVTDDSGRTGSSSKTVKPFFSISIPHITTTGKPNETLKSSQNPTPVSTSTGSTSTDSGVLGGSIVGAISGTALVVGLGTYLLRRWRRQRQALEDHAGPSSVEQGLTSPEKDTETEPKSGGSAELEANERAVELATSAHLAELPTPNVVSELDGSARTLVQADSASSENETSENAVHGRFNSDETDMEAESVHERENRSSMQFDGFSATSK